jgi:hypothetical protein
MEKPTRQINITKGKLPEFNKINGSINVSHIFIRLLNVITANDKTKQIHKGEKEKKQMLPKKI